MRSVLRWFGLASSIAAWSCGDGGLVVRTISEYHGSPIAGVKVQVDDQPWQTTDAAGEARFAKAAGAYTVRIHQPMTFKTPQGVSHVHDKVWQLIGRTANPLVFEVDGSLADSYDGHRAQFSGTVTGRSGTTSRIVLSVEGGGGLVAADGTFDRATIDWEAGTTIDRVVRALESSVENPPVHYMGYGSTRVRFTDNDGFLGPGGEVKGVNIQLHPMSEARVSGQVTRPEQLGQGDLAAYPQLRFGRYDWLGLAAVTTQAGAFDYAMPIVDGGTPWIGFAGPFVTSGDSFTIPHGWHYRKVALPSTGVGFALPAAPVLLEPADAAPLSQATIFRWMAVEPNITYELDVDCGDWSEAGTIKNIHYRGIETTGTEASLPAFAGVIAPAGTPCIWRVWWQTDSDSELRGSSSGFRTGTFQ